MVKQLPELPDCSAMNTYSAADHITTRRLFTNVSAGCTKTSSSTQTLGLLCWSPCSVPGRPGCTVGVGALYLQLPGL